MATQAGWPAEAQVNPEHQALVDQAMPGWKIVNPAEARQRRMADLGGAAPTDMGSPSLADMKGKWDSATGAARAADAVDSAAIEARAPLESQIVTVESLLGERKTIIVRDGKVSGFQG